MRIRSCGALAILLAVGCSTQQSRAPATQLSSDHAERAADTVLRVNVRLTVLREVAHVPSAGVGWTPSASAVSIALYAWAHAESNRKHERARDASNQLASQTPELDFRSRMYDAQGRVLAGLGWLELGRVERVSQIQPVIPFDTLGGSHISLLTDLQFSHDGRLLYVWTIVAYMPQGQTEPSDVRALVFVDEVPDSEDDARTELSLTEAMRVWSAEGGRRYQIALQKSVTDLEKMLASALRRPMRGLSGDHEHRDWGHEVLETASDGRRIVQLGDGRLLSVPAGVTLSSLRSATRSLTPVGAGKSCRKSKASRLRCR